MSTDSHRKIEHLGVEHTGFSVPFFSTLVLTAKTFPIFVFVCTLNFFNRKKKSKLQILLSTIGNKICDTHIQTRKIFQTKQALSMGGLERNVYLDPLPRLY